MFRPRTFVLPALAFVLAAPATAQDSLRIMDPQSLSGSGAGWSVSPATGHLGMAIPFASVPGDIPIGLPFQFKGSHVVETRHVLNPDYVDGLDPISARWILVPHDRPVHGGMSFGCITGTSIYDAYTENSSYILEDGSQFRERDFKAYTGSAALGAPVKFGLSAKSWAQVKTHVSTRLIAYDAVAADLGTWATQAAALAPDGFLPGGATGYKVIMDKDRARIYAFAVDFGAWVPILWLDRFGHSASFQWRKGASGEITVYSVKATNQAASQAERGVQVQWAVMPFTETEVEHVILRADYIGFQAPSIQVKGFSGFGYQNPVALGGYPDYIAPPMAGPVLRPTQIASGDPTNNALAAPAWIVGGLPVPTATWPDPWAPVLSWSFTYDANNAELTDFTDAMGVKTTFGYGSLTFYDGTPSNTNLVRGVTGATSDNLAGTKFTRVWNRSLIPVWNSATLSWTSTSWKTSLVQRFTTGAAADVPTQEWTFAGPNYGVHYGNGALVSERLYTTAKTYVTQVHAPGSYGIDGTLSTDMGPSLTVDGRPSQSTVITRDSLSGAPNVETLKVGGVDWQEITYGYDANPDLLDPLRLTSVATKRRVNGLLVSAPTHKIDYDPTSGLTAHDYLESGTLKRGKSYGYDGNGHLTFVGSYPSGTPSIGTTYTPDSDGLPTHASTTFSSPADGGTSTFTQDWTYSPAGRTTSAKDGRGVTTFTAYDSRGRVRSVGTQGSPTTTLTYPSEFQRNWSTGTGGVSGGQTSDAFGRMVSRSGPTGTETPTYDTLGRVTVMNQVSGGTSRKTYAGYDPLGRTVSASSYASPLSQTITYLADGTSAKVTTLLSNNVSSSVWTDPLGQTVAASDPWSSVSSVCNELGLPTSVVQTAGGTPQTRSFAYNALGDLTSRTEPETGTTAFTLQDAFGNPTSIYDGVRTRTLAFDGLGRLRSVSNGSSILLNWVFNGLLIKNASTVSNGQTVTQNYSFGAASGGARLNSEKLSLGGLDQTTSYSYDARGRLDTIAYPSGRQVKYGGYDGLGRVGSVMQNSLPLATVHYDPIWGSRADITFTSGAKSSWTTDLAGVNLQTWSIAPVGIPAEISNYGVDANGNLNKGGGWDPLTHDQAGRLTAANGFGESVTLSHDGYGNNTSSNTAPAPTGTNNFGFTTMPNNKVPATQANGALSGWLYAGNGEASQIGSATGNVPVIGLTWDGLGRLASATNGPTWTNTYAPSGLRVQLNDSVNPGNNRRYAYTSGGLLLGEYVQSGAAGHASAKAAKVNHRASGGGDISRSLGAFSVGETVTVTVWFKAPVGTSGSAYLTDNAAYSATDNKKAVALQGNGDWQQLSLSQTLTQATALTLHLYGDMYTSTSATATDNTFVTYDDVMVSSSTRGTVLTEDFEAGISAWGSCSGNLALAQPGTAPDQWKRDVIYLGGEAIAEVDAAGVHELHNDHLGSPRVITAGLAGMAAPLGAVEGRQVFGPYGEKLPAYTSGYAPLTGYTGHLQQDPSGLTYMRGRFYSTAWHRFLNSDQGVDPSTFNQMAYVGGSPFQMVDPSGMMETITGSNCVDGHVEITWSDEHGGGITITSIPCGGVDSHPTNNEVFSLGDGPRVASLPPEPDCPEGPKQDLVDKVGNFGTGVADGLSWGIGPWLRGLRDPDGEDHSVDQSSASYQFGSWAAVFVGVARTAYAGSAKAVSIFASSGARASVIRQSMKSTLRLGAAQSWRSPDLAKYGTDAALRAAAGRTNAIANIYGAGVAAAGVKNASGCGSKK